MHPPNANILEYCAAELGNDSDMLKLSLVVFAVPATQVSVEKCFSGLNLILTKFRSRLTPENLANLLIVKMNFDMLEFEDTEIFSYDFD